MMELSIFELAAADILDCVCKGYLIARCHTHELRVSSGVQLVNEGVMIHQLELWGACSSLYFEDEFLAVQTQPLGFSMLLHHIPKVQGVLVCQDLHY